MASQTVTKAPVELLQLAPSTIKAHPDNPRRDVGDVGDLAASIKEVGLLEPLIVAPAHDGLHLTPAQRSKDPRYLIAGHRRLAAAKMAGLKHVPCLFRADLTSRAAQIEAMVVENTQRADLSPIEEGDAYQLLLDITPKATQAAIAKATGQPRSRVSERLRLRKLSDTVQARVHAGQVSIHDAIALTTLTDRPDLLEQVEKEIGTNNFAWQLKHAQRLREDQIALEKAERAVRTDGGMTILDAPPSWRGSPRLLNSFNSPAAIADGAGFTAAHQANGSCPGRAAYIVRDRIAYGCNQPELHEQPAPSGTDAQADATDRAFEMHSQMEQWIRSGALEIPAATVVRHLAVTDYDDMNVRSTEEQAARDARVAAEAAYREKVEQLTAARDVRLDWWSAQITKADPRIAEIVLAGAYEVLADNGECYVTWPAYLNGASWKAEATLLDLNPDIDPDDRDAACRSVFSTMSGTGIAIHTAYSMFVGDALSILPVTIDPTETRETIYVATLTNAGYEWSDLERDTYGINADGYVEGGDE